MPYSPDTGAGWSPLDPNSPLDAIVDSRYGGLTPWTQSMKDYAQLGQPMGDRPFGGVGKTNIAEQLPLTPIVAKPEGSTPTDFTGAPQPGIGEALLGGITGMVGEFAGGILQIPGESGFVQGAVSGATNVMGAIGSVFDGILDVVPVLHALPGGGDIKAQFESLDTDEKKLQYMELINAHPDHALEYMHEYLSMRGGELARRQGASGIWAEMATPSMNFSEQLRRIVFGGLMAGSNAVARTYVGSSVRNVEGTVLGVDPSTLPPELQEQRARFERGDITYDEFLDEITLGRYRWTQDEGLTGMGISMVLDIFTDPLIWASAGMGLTAKAGLNPAIRKAALRVSEVASKGEGGLAMARELAPKFGMSPEEFLKSTSHEHRAAITDWAKTKSPDVYKKGMDSLSAKERTFIAMEKPIRAAVKVTQTIDQMGFNMFGNSPVGKRLALVRNNARIQGHLGAVGLGNAKKVQDLFDDPQVYADGLAISDFNMGITDYQKAKSSEMLATNRSLDMDVTTGAGSGKPGLSPTEAGTASVQQGIEAGYRQEGERSFLRNMESTVRGVGKEEVPASRSEFIRSIAEGISHYSKSSVDQLIAKLDKMDEKGIAHAHEILFGLQVRETNAAKKAYHAGLLTQLEKAKRGGKKTAKLVREIERDIDIAERLTLISENTLTDNAARALLETIKPDTDAARAATREAIQQYDQLHINWSEDSRKNLDIQRNELIDHLTAVLEKPNALPTVLEYKDLDAGLKAALDNGGGRYSFGVAPEDAWGIVQNGDGTIKSINPFAYSVSDVDMGPRLNRRITNYDRIKGAFLDPITGSRIAAENRMNMRRIGAMDYGLTKGQSDAFFHAVQAAAIKSEKGMRAFTPQQLSEIAVEAKVSMPRDIQVKYGERAWLDFTLRSFQGNIQLQGLGTGFSGKLKSGTGRLDLGDNLLSRIAEDLYPKLRFTYSPMFLAMELVEGPFFGLLRGIKPGYRWTRKDVELNAIVRTMAPDYVEIGAGTTRGIIAKGDSLPGLRVAEANLWDKTWNKVMPAKWGREPQRIRGPRFYKVYEWKRLMYNRQIGERMGREFVGIANKTEQGRQMLGALESAYKTHDPTTLWMRYMEEKGMFDPAARHQVHMMDAARPHNMARARVRLSDVAHFMEHENVASLKDALNNGDLTREAFIDRYERLGLNKEYAERAYTVARGFTEKEWVDEMVKAVGEDAAQSAIDWHRNMARLARMDMDEFLNVTYGEVARIVSSGRKIPAAALKQSAEAALGPEGLNTVVAKRGEARFEKVRSRVKSMVPGTTPDTNRPSGTPYLAKTVRLGVEGVKKGKGAPPSTISRMAELVEAEPAKRAEAYAKMYSTYKEVIGNTEDFRNASNWYDDVQTVMIGLAHAMSDGQVEELMRLWKDKDKAVAKMSAEEVRDELAARLQLAFAGTQQNLSPLDGLKMIGQMLEEVAHELDKDGIVEHIANRRGVSLEEAASKMGTRYGMDSVVARLDALLREFEALPAESLGQKLTDFIDSLSGNLTRTADGGIHTIGKTAIRPAAMDIWMRRVFNFGDTAYLEYLRDQKMVLEGLTKEQAEKAVRAERGWQGKLSKPMAPSGTEYEWMLHKVNEMTDWLNGEGEFAGMGRGIPGEDGMGPNASGRWEPAEVQAMLWVGEQKLVDYPTQPVPSIIQDAGQQIGVGREGAPGIFPTRQEMVKAYGDEAGSVLHTVQADVATNLYHTINQELNIPSLRNIDSPNGATQVLFITKEQGFDVSARLAVALDQPIFRMGSGAKRNSLDISFGELTNAQAAPYMLALGEYLEPYLPKNFKWQMGGALQDGSVGLRSITTSKAKTGENVLLPTMNVLPEQVVNELTDGTWVKRVPGSEKSAPQPVIIQHSRVDFEVITPEAGAKHLDGLGEVGAADRYRSYATRAAESAHAEGSPVAFTASGQRTANAGTGTGAFAQRSHTGAVRAGFQAATDAERAVLYFVNGSADGTSAIHETFHLFARNLDQSARDQFRDAYNGAHHLTGRDAKREFTRDVEEWVAAEFEAFAAGEFPPDASYASTFHAYAQWGKAHGIKKGSQLGDLFDKVLEDWKGTPAGLSNLDDVRISEAVRYAMLKTEEESHSTGYYRRGNSWLMRSMNHPYMGFYPASYMWGKVLPEMSRFLLKKPFGVSAPLGGLMAFGHVYRNIQMQLDSDPEMAKFLEDHPDTVRMLAMMVPGSPVEMPVNLPVVARRAAELEAENRGRRIRGEETEPFDPFGWFGDMASYSVGFTQTAGRFADAAGEWFNDDEA